MHDLYRTGLYSHADIAYILGVSASSVTTWLRKRSQHQPAMGDKR